MPKHPAEQTTPRVRATARAVRLASRVRDWFQTASGSSFCGGTIAGLFVVAFCHPMFARYGSGLITTSAAAAGTALGLLAGAVGRSRTGSRFAAALVVAIWFLAIGPLAAALDLGLHTVDFELLALPWGQFAAALAGAVLFLAVPAACVSRLVMRNEALDGAWTCVGVAAGCLLAAYGFGPWFGVNWTGWIAIALTLAWVAGALASRWNVPGAEESIHVQGSALRTASSAARPPGTALVQIATNSVAAGLAAGALVRLVEQLMPGTEALEWTMCAGFLLGAAVAARVGTERTSIVVLLAAIGCAIPVVLFAAWTDVFLVATATFSNVSLLLLVRGLAATVALFAAGTLWSAAVAWRAVDGNSKHATLLIGAAPALLAGLICARWLILLGAPVPVLVAAGAFVPATFAAASSIRTSAVRGKWIAGGAWATAAALFAVGVFARTYEPTRSARLLFATNVFMAWRTGTESRLLPFLDDSRLLLEEEGENGTYTVWKQRGSQIALRESGIPNGTFCPRPEIGPQFSGEIVPCILPLVLHESPRHMLILGLASGSGLAASLEFPIEEVTCVEGDRALIDVLESTFWPAAQPNPRNDNRTRIVCAEPGLVMQARGGQYDIVYADSGQSSVSRGTAHFTREFYSAAARQLADDGIFAQRFVQVDYGPWPLESALATLKTVFPHVAAIEVAQGELTLLATRSDKGLDRPGLLERFQTPQARRTLAHIGWDWSVVLNLAAYSGENCDALCRGASINTAANGLFAFRLPQETMRWGPKNEELAAALGPHAGRMAQWQNVDGNDTELLRRLSDVMREHDLMTSYPDQPWAYRKLVREELTKHPHTTIENGEAGLERRLDAVDRRRLDYFKALGKVSQAARPTLAALHRIEEFAEPFDSVLTYFLHHELAAFYGRSEAAGSMAQLEHRLYTIYYSDPRDRSVRDVVDAMEILTRESQLVSGDQRWDYLNALLAFLEARWLNRGLGKPKSTDVVLNDLERSIEAVEASLDLMDRLRSTVGVAEADWAARRSVIERGLARPLRSYRSELIPEYQKETDKTASSESAESSEPHPSAN
jgi:Spermine/spermidine synthase domain